MSEKRLTVKQLHKLLGEMIDTGKGRLPVAINKSSFTHPLESSGAAILPVKACEVEAILICDGDGFIERRSNGTEKSQLTAVLTG